ncbi:hypothetical protein [Candidatus Nitrosotenuis chungbukensis]|uniref:hypothetical protein n=1 Tax=Candidatus Nitrosotenuis chungbukensis TaxID=1353246 RepID=UPI0006931D8D|nr:hypothetical protein [Candidatus Nitrosotenuis chungbukensis]
MIKLLGISLMVALVILANTSLHSDAAVTYEKQENSKYVKDRIAEPLKGKSGWWKYILRVCADDHSLGITEVVLSSDIETIYQGVNKVIPKGDCSIYGAVMKAKNGNTLGYKITQSHEAVQKVIDSKQGKITGSSWSEIGRYKFILGYF